MQAGTELAEKRRRVLALLDAEGLDALVLRRPGNVAWYSGGGRTHIAAVQEVGVADVVVRRDGDEVVTAVNEAARLEVEELGALGAAFRVLPWTDVRDAALPLGERTGSDSPLAGARDVSAAVEAARRSLTAEEAERFRALGRDAAEALTQVCRTLDPGRSEHDAAARVAGALVERAIDPVVLLVAGEARLPLHRHPLPTGEPLGRLAMLVACARRGGLIASLTRFVSFGPLEAGLAEAYERLLHVDAAFNGATVPGARVGEAFARGVAAYAEHGFDAQEWRLHHQGGPTGYEPRDYLADAGSAAVVEEPRPSPGTQASPRSSRRTRSWPGARSSRSTGPGRRGTSTARAAARPRALRGLETAGPVLPGPAAGECGGVQAVQGACGSDPRRPFRRPACDASRGSESRTGLRGLRPGC